MWGTISARSSGSGAAVPSIWYCCSRTASSRSLSACMPADGRVIMPSRTAALQPQLQDRSSVDLPHLEHRITDAADIAGVWRTDIMASFCMKSGMSARSPLLLHQPDGDESANRLQL